MFLLNKDAEHVTKNIQTLDQSHHYFNKHKSKEYVHYLHDVLNNKHV